MSRGAGGFSFKVLMVISFGGGIVGAILLLVTPSSIFRQLVPWLVLFATAVFAYGSFVPRKEDRPPRAGQDRRGPGRSSPSRSMAAISAAASAF